jgi:hypothetical protein
MKLTVGLKNILQNPKIPTLLSFPKETIGRRLSGRRGYARCREPLSVARSVCRKMVSDVEARKA